MKLIDAKKIEKRIENIFKDDQKVQLRYPENSASGLKRIINNFSQFLSLVSISAMLDCRNWNSKYSSYLLSIKTICPLQLEKQLGFIREI